MDLEKVLPNTVLQKGFRALEPLGIKKSIFSFCFSDYRYSSAIHLKVEAVMKKVDIHCLIFQYTLLLINLKLAKKKRNIGQELDNAKIKR